VTRSTTTTSPQTEHSKHWTSGSPSISGSRACSRSPDERSHFGQVSLHWPDGCVLMIGGGQIRLDTTARSPPKCALCDNWSRNLFANPPSDGHSRKNGFHRGSAESANGSKSGSQLTKRELMAVMIRLAAAIEASGPSPLKERRCRRVGCIREGCFRNSPSITQSWRVVPSEPNRW
jgi:hypothetical protein